MTAGFSEHPPLPRPSRPPPLPPDPCVTASPDHRGSSPTPLHEGNEVGSALTTVILTPYDPDHTPAWHP